MRSTMWASTVSTIDRPPLFGPEARPTGGPDEDTGVGDALDRAADAPRLLVFTAAGRICACELTVVREIIPYRGATRLPGAQSHVVGLINLRGSIITVLDLGVRLGGGAVDPDRGSIILVESRSKVVGLAVDELRDVERIVPGTIEPSADDRIGGGLLSGVVRINGDLAVLLDVGRIVGDALL